MATRAIPGPLGYSENQMSDASNFLPGRVGIQNSALLYFDGANNNNSGGAGANPNQALGVIKIPAGTASGTTITVANTRITGLDWVFPVCSGDPGSGLYLLFKNFTWTVGVGVTWTQGVLGSGSTTTQDCDVQYVIFN